MINPELIEFIKKELSLGKTKEQIKSELFSGGWNDRDINEAFLSLMPSASIQKQTSISGKFLASKIFIFLVVLTLLGLGGVYAFDKEIFQKIFSNSSQETSVSNTELIQDSHSIEINDFEGMKKVMTSGLSYKCSSVSSYKDEKSISASTSILFISQNQLREESELVVENETINLVGGGYIKIYEIFDSNLNNYEWFFGKSGEISSFANRFLSPQDREEFLRERYFNDILGQKTQSYKCLEEYIDSSLFVKPDNVKFDEPEIYESSLTKQIKKSLNTAFDGDYIRESNSFNGFCDSLEVKNLQGKLNNLGSELKCISDSDDYVFLGKLPSEEYYCYGSNASVGLALYISKDKISSIKADSCGREDIKELAPKVKSIIIDIVNDSNIYYKKHSSYKDFCKSDDITSKYTDLKGIYSRLTCIGNTSSYIVTAKDLESNEYFCVDTTSKIDGLNIEKISDSLPKGFNQNQFTYSCKKQTQNLSSSQNTNTENKLYTYESLYPIKIENINITNFGGLKELILSGKSYKCTENTELSKEIPRDGFKFISKAYISKGKLYLESLSSWQEKRSDHYMIYDDKLNFYGWEEEYYIDNQNNKNVREPINIKFKTNDDRYDHIESGKFWTILRHKYGNDYSLQCVLENVDHSIFVPSNKIKFESQ